MNATGRMDVMDPSPRTPRAAVESLSRSERAPDSARRAGRAVGILMLGAFLAYGVGSSLATSVAGAPDPGESTALLVAGVASMLLNTGIVIAIGILVFPILRRHSGRAAALYLATRIFEGIGLGAGAVALLVLTGPAAIETNFVAYNAAMAGLGIGSIAFCVVLFRSRLVPRFLAVWGLVGYASFAAGSVLELAGVAGAGLVSAIPGGAFEVVFGIWLIAKGFRTVTAG